MEGQGRGQEWWASKAAISREDVTVDSAQGTGQDGPVPGRRSPQTTAAVQARREGAATDSVAAPRPAATRRPGDRSSADTVAQVTVPNPCPN